MTAVTQKFLLGTITDVKIYCHYHQVDVDYESSNDSTHVFDLSNCFCPKLSEFTGSFPDDVFGKKETITAVDKETDLCMSSWTLVMEVDGSLAGCGHRLWSFTDGVGRCSTKECANYIRRWPHWPTV